jgi:beta-glucosidase
VIVTNTGDRAGQEVAQLYVRDLYASMTPPVKRLRAFRKIHLDAGAQERVSFNVPVQDLAFINEQNQATLEPGDFEVEIGTLRASFSLE